VFIRDAPLIILDKPTASMDPRRTRPVHSHPLPLRGQDGAADLAPVQHRPQRRHIYVLDSGRIIEHGNHDQLITAAGVYAKLFTWQAKAYTDHPASPTDITTVRIPRCSPSHSAKRPPGKQKRPCQRSSTPAARAVDAIHHGDIARLRHIPADHPELGRGALIEFNKWRRSAEPAVVGRIALEARMPIVDQVGLFGRLFGAAS